ncbi:MAG TPA: S1/P1 nuclease [Pyrinomonadaceae bacterium]|nr:S1/P1 nuclease [Pyrinomonadaceae bacterium]
MLQPIVKTLLAAIAAMLFAPPGFSWDDNGHKITGYIAWQRMSPQAREKVIRILRTAPEESDIATFYVVYGPKSEDLKRLEYFMFMPTWADVIRDRSFPVRYEKFHRGDWHYKSQFWRRVNGQVEMNVEKKADGQATEKLAEFDKAMRNPSLSDAEKAVAIAWFLHIGGDIHQPLHTSSRQTDVEPNGDVGGNTFQLTPEGTKREDQLNLHWFWDSIVGRNIPFRDDMSEFHYLRNIAESMMARYPYDNRSSLLFLGDYEKWKTESFFLATTEVFNDELKRFVLPGDRYVRNAYRVSEERLAMAGYRMGDTLNEIFGK